MASRGRGRPRKPRETRMDAAVDNMKNYGFEEKLIKSTVKELLKVYGGSEAWPLIEDGCYAALLEVLLQKNKEKESGNEASTSRNEEGGSQLDQPEEILALEQNPDAIEAGSAEPLNDAAEPPFSDIADNASGNDYTGMEDFRGVDVDLNVPAINPDGNPETNITHPLAIIPPQPPVGTIPNPRRKPCYGWLSDEDEDNDGIVYVPAKLPAKPRRERRWDVGPDAI